MRSVSIYIDTSIRGPGRHRGLCLYILSFQTAAGKTADMGRWIRREETTWNQLVLLGLEEALGHLREPCHLALYLECPYVAAVLRNGWTERWAAAGWKNAKGREVKDAAVWLSAAGLLAWHETVVLLKQDHPYRMWMGMELARREICDRTRKGSRYPEDPAGLSGESIEWDLSAGRRQTCRKQKL